MYFLCLNRVRFINRVNLNIIKRTVTDAKTFENDVVNEAKRLHDIPGENIRNFSIIAHVDHGKSTLADRFLEVCGLISPASSNQQVLDSLPVERERGITVKAQTASLLYSFQGREYLLNLIDTPGHVDFSNEVSRSLAACQGVILLVDANQGVQAQTVANYFLALNQGLTIIPALNKIDLKNAEPGKVCSQLESLFGTKEKDVLKVSAKLGIGVEELIEAVIERISPPSVDRSAPLQALLIDSWYDKYRGVVGLVSVKAGEVKEGDIVRWCCSSKDYTVRTLGVLRPHEIPTKTLCAGQVGVLTCGMREKKEAVVGDTLVSGGTGAAQPLQGFTLPRPVVFAGVYPLNQADHLPLRQALDKLTLNDSAVSITTDTSPGLGHGWRVGFLGLLHMEVFNQRLEQEFGAHAVITSPSVTFKVSIVGQKNIKKYGKSELMISNPTDLPDVQIIEEIQEPIVLATIITPASYLGDMISLCTERRGVQNSAVNIDSTRIMLKYTLPLCEIVVDFHDRLKSISSGFASFDYEDAGFVKSSITKVNIHLNGDLVEELCFFVHSSKAREEAQRRCLKLLDIIPRQQFLVIIQAKIGSKIIARENLKPYRKDVTAKLYGGDVTRRKKLLKRQAEGKQRLKMISNIALPRDTFIQVFRR